MSFGRRKKPALLPPAGEGRRILFPFDAHGLVDEALRAALRLARAEGGTIVPVFLARVPMHMALDSALPRQSQLAVPMQEAVEQRAGQAGVPVESRIERGRSYRHAMRQMIEHERFDMIVLAAAAGHGPGFGPADVAWLLANAPGEIVVLRPQPSAER